MPKTPYGLNESKDTFLDRQDKEIINDDKNLTEKGIDINLFVTINNLKYPFTNIDNLIKEVQKAKPNLKFRIYNHIENSFILEPVSETENYSNLGQKECVGVSTLYTL